MSTNISDKWVSVIMPAFNSSSTIRSSINSVLSQNHEKFELIIVNDGSNDDTYEICANYKDERIKIINQKNRGLAGARNTGIRHSRFKFLAFIDSDDLWTNNKLCQHLVHLCNDHRLGISFSRSKFIDADDNIIGTSQMPKLKNISSELILCRNPISNGSCVVLKKEVLDDIKYQSLINNNTIEDYWFDDDFKQSEDIECWLRISLTTNWKFEGIPQALTLYRVNNSGLSSNTRSQLQSWEKVIEKTSKYNSNFIERFHDKALSYQLRYLSRREFYLGNSLSALKLYFSAICQWPFIIVKEPCKSFITFAAILTKIILPKRLSLLIEKSAMRFVGETQSLRIKFELFSDNLKKRIPNRNNVDILVVCSSGGHYSACQRFKSFLDSYSTVWVTFKNKSTAFDLEKQSKYWAFHPTNRNIINFLKNLVLALVVFLRHNPKLIITTGAGVSVPFVFIGKIFRKKSIFIESITRSSRLSLSAKLCLPFLDQCIVQWPLTQTHSSKIKKFILNSK